MKQNIAYLFVTLLFLTACSDNTEQLNADYGKPQVRDRIVNKHDPLADHFLNKVKPILENRCVVCHGCYDAPCQLKLSSVEGIDRGFSPELIYTTRFSEIDPTRLFIDAHNTQEWRDKKKPFKPVLNERDQTPIANLQGSVLYQMLTQKNIHPLPQTPVLSEDDFDFSLNRKQTCPSIETFEKYKQDFPLGGMPYGLPAISDNEFKTIETWVEQGAPMAQPEPVTLSIENRIIEWEMLLNKKDNKSVLVNRYIYEHLFLAHLYFSEETLQKEQQPNYFRLVRSTTPPGKPIIEIPSRRPYDDPVVATFYYRLRLDTGTILTKTHLPYALNAERKQRWNELFYENDFHVKFVPDYKQENPFLVFAEIPAELRYQFMLDEAEFTIMGFIKGPVCRGQVALNVIQDKFWVFFTNPVHLKDKVFSDFIYQQAGNLELPSQQSRTHLALSTWSKYSKLEKAYLQAQQKVVLDNNLKLKDYSISAALFSGNDTAALTIFRNFDSGVVLKGLHGRTPKTAWIIDYPILERIHYLLVAGYEVYGSIRHQLITRLYMDFLRLESEMAFISLLPLEQRRPEIKSWYLNSTNKLKEYLEDDHFFFIQENSITYKTDHPKQELLTSFQQYYADLYGKENSRRVSDGPLSILNKLPNLAVQQVSQTSFIFIENGDEKANSYTLLRHNQHANVASLLKEDKNRLPELDYAEVFNGFIGSYPSTIFHLQKSQLSAFAEQFKEVSDPMSYQKLLDQFALRRSSPDFWQVSDRIHQLHRQDDPIIYGLFDYNRLENR